MVAYALGGPLADRFSVRKMMAGALWATAAGGLVAARGVSPQGLVLLYAYWGMTTILMFWAGMLRATRAWGGDDAQGRAYGLLDGGRGLVGALLSTVALAAFAASMAQGDAEAERAGSFAIVLGLASLVTALAGVAVWWAVPDSQGPADGPRFDVAQIGATLRRPALWPLGGIVICAYVGYKGTDDLSLLTVDVLGATETQAATVGTLAFWIRPLAAVGAGLLADHIGGWRTVLGAFLLLLLADLAVVGGVVSVHAGALLVAIIATCVAVYALRGVYFALLQEAGVPLAATGTAVGIVSFVGYTPDVFFGPLMGTILDGKPGAPGHRDLFLVLAGFAALGALCTVAFARLRPQPSEQ